MKEQLAKEGEEQDKTEDYQERKEKEQKRRECDLRMKLL